jgi:hypothetical protein
VHVSIMIHTDRRRLGLAEGEPHYDELEKQSLISDQRAFRLSIQLY